ncbi:hypothetical protein [Haloechinothrix sp. LS1_15]|uniref:hypothetical protein n=1 Tax=Haloechinothrix sp. LS1_15 TaxID=2652248 RepID=UPI002944D9C5|nr:hypothetical protein [Haloechinothrix sp. LS1_15]MDV6011621.1 hypothetical protein [Haloechinothrix sp. LS1_15]
MVVRLCETTGCRDGRRGHRRARPAVPGLRLCPPCRQAAARCLTELPDLYSACERALAQRGGRDVERVRGGRPQGIRLNDDAVAARSDIVDLLTSWSSLVSEDREVAPPADREVPTLASFLASHLDWLAAHAAAADFVAELTHLRGVARQVIQPGDRLTLEIGPCPRPGCGWPVRAMTRSADGMPPRVGCEAGHTWHPDQWLLLDGRTGHRSGSGRGGQDDEGRAA